MRVELGQAWRDTRTRRLYPTGSVVDLDEATAAELIRMRWAKAGPEPLPHEGPPGGAAPPGSSPGEGELPSGGAPRGRHRRRDMRAEDS